MKQLSRSGGGWARRAALVGGLLCFLPVLAAWGQSMTVTTSPGAMVINMAVAGLAPTARTSNATTIRIAGRNNRTYKITARINTAMPPGVALQVTVTAPTGATALGPVTLDATARDVVTNIVNRTAENETITYVLSATAAAGVVTSRTRTVTFTMTQTP